MRIITQFSGKIIMLEEKIRMKITRGPNLAPSFNFQSGGSSGCGWLSPRLLCSSMTSPRLHQCPTCFRRRTPKIPEACECRPGRGRRSENSFMTSILRLLFKKSISSPFLSTGDRRRGGSNSLVLQYYESFSAL